MIEARTDLIQETQCLWFEPKRIKQMVSPYFVDVTGDTMTGNLVLSGGAVALFGADTDTQNIIGKARISFIGNVDGAGFQHYDMPVDTSSYALLQQATGRTFLNCANGVDIRFRVANVDKMMLTSTGFRVGSAVAPTVMLDVTGAIKASTSCTAATLIGITSLATPLWENVSALVINSNVGDDTSSIDFRINGTGVADINLTTLATMTSKQNLVVTPTTVATNTINDSLIVRHTSSGTAAAAFGVGVKAQLESSTTNSQDAGRLTWEWDVATHASRASRGKLSAYYTATERICVDWKANATVPLIGFLGTAPVAKPAAYTQTYATTSRTHANVTAVDPAAYGAGANGYSTGAMAAAVHAEVIALRADLVNVKNVLNQVIDDIQAYGLLA